MNIVQPIKIKYYIVIGHNILNGIKFYIELWEYQLFCNKTFF